MEILPQEPTSDTTSNFFHSCTIRFYISSTILLYCTRIRTSIIQLCQKFVFFLQIKAQFVSIKLKPVDFEHYLVEKIGFARIETISNNSGCKESGFATSHGQQRSIYACFKD